MIDDNECPPLDVLSEDSSSRDVRQHVLECPRCRALLQLLEPVSPEPATPEAWVAPAAAPSAVCVGDVYAIRSPHRADLTLGVVTSRRAGKVEVLALTEDAHWATEDDLLVPPEVLGFSAALHTKVNGIVLDEQLDECLGTIGELSAALQDLQSSLDRGAPILTREDPRASWHGALEDAWSDYLEPALSLRETVTLGGLLALRRRALALLVPEVAAMSGLEEREVPRLEGDELDLGQRVPPHALAELLGGLRVLFSGELADRIRLALIEGADPAPTLAMRRSGRIVAAATSGKGPDEYVAAVARHMSGAAGGEDDSTLVKG